jgi:hypothetical protein
VHAATLAAEDAATERVREASPPPSGRLLDQGTAVAQAAAAAAAARLAALALEPLEDLPLEDGAPRAPPKAARRMHLANSDGARERERSGEFACSFCAPLLSPRVNARARADSAHTACCRV